MNLLGPPHSVKGKGWHLLLTLVLDFINPYQVSPDMDRPLPRAFRVGLAGAYPTRTYEIKYLGLLALILAGLSACGGPTLYPATPAGSGAIVQEAPGLRTSVQAGAWQGRPGSLTGYVLPFLVSLRNTGTAQVSIARTDFSLLDDANRQYLPLAPIEVVAIMGGSGSGTVVYPSVGVGGSTGSWGSSTAFGLGLGAVFGGYGTDTRDIIPQALAEGPIQPGAEVMGFLYFPLPAPGYKSLRLVFAPRDPPGQPRLDFEFRPAGQ